MTGGAVGSAVDNSRDHIKFAGPLIDEAFGSVISRQPEIMPAKGARMRLSLMMGGTILALMVGPAVAWSQGTTLTPPGNPECQDYTVQAAIEGRPATVVGHACQAPDGRWQVVEGAPPQASIVPPLTAYSPIPPLTAYPPPSVYYPYGSWLVGPPVAFGAGSALFFGNRQFSRFHAAHGFRRFPRFFFRFHAGVPHHFRSAGVRSFGVRSFGMGGGGHR